MRNFVTIVAVWPALLFSLPPPVQATHNEAPTASAQSAAPPKPEPTQGYDLPQFALAGPKGFGFASQDGSFNLILHWLVQSDFRDFINESPVPDRDTFIVRF